MNFFVEFYKGLDAINLIIFWGVIIVVLLLLIFAIIIANKNKKLERIIEKSGIDIDSFDTDEELAIKKENKIDIQKDKPILTETNVEIKETQINHNEIANNEFIGMPTIIPTSEDTIPIKEEKFVAEEHVMEYHEEKPETSQVKVEELTNEYNTAPYQRNVLREMSSNQTSPIGIAIKRSDDEKEISKAKELHIILDEDNNNEDSIEKETLLNQKNYATSYNQNVRKGDYLEELSKKLSNASYENDINRTDYELKQEEEAIISYQELMAKKDSIKTIDEEEAVISIDELRAKKAQEEKLYNITKDEENDEFISELKHFRSDL